MKGKNMNESDTSVMINELRSCLHARAIEPAATLVYLLGYLQSQAERDEDFSAKLESAITSTYQFADQLGVR
jgi:hypothetical protein